MPCDDAEIAGIRLQDKEHQDCWQPPEARKTQGSIFPQSLQREHDLANILFCFFCFLFFLIFEFYFILSFIQQVLISHQFYTQQCIHVNPNLPIDHTTIPTPPPLSPLGVHTFVLYICVSISALQTGSSVPFF